MAEDDDKKIREFLGQARPWQIQNDLVSAGFTKNDFEEDRFALGRFGHLTNLGFMMDYTNFRVDTISIRNLQQMLYNLDGINWSGGSWGQAFLNLIDLLDDSGAMDQFFSKFNLTDLNIVKDLVTDIDTTSQASKEWTVPTGKAWMVVFASMKNATRTYGPVLYVTPSGGSETRITGVALQSANGSVTTNLIGTQMIHASYGVNGSGVKYLDAGDKIKLADEGSFQAGDNMTFSIGYVEVSK